MRAIDVANIFIAKYGSQAVLSNLSLNKLVYFAQVESVRCFGEPLFEDGIEAWEYGPVEPSVYHALKSHGSRRILDPTGPVPDDRRAEEIVDATFAKYGQMTAYDLVDLSHREGGAWRATYVPGADREITANDILRSADGVAEPPSSGTLASGIRLVNDSWPNTFELLRNS